MHGRRLRCLGPVTKRWGVPASLCLLTATAGCERESPEVEAPPEAPVQLVLDTVAIIHSDLFHYVGGVGRLASGDLVVMNSGSVDVLLLDASGNQVGTVGRLGEGPGEFLGVLDMDTRGDSILVLDGLRRRVNLFHRDSFVAMWSLRGTTGTPQQVGFSSSGTPVATVARRTDTGQENAGKVLRDTIEFYRVDRTEAALPTPIEVPGGEHFVFEADGGLGMGVPAFSAWGTYDLTLTGVIFADARDGRVVSFGWDGQAVRTLRPASQPTSVSEAELDRVLERNEAVASQRPSYYMAFVRQAIEVWGESVPRPFYSAVISDGSETLIEHFAPRSADSVEWSLLGEDGTTLGTFDLGPTTELHSIQNREVLGVGRDSLDVEHVIVFRIREAAGSG